MTFQFIRLRMERDKAFTGMKNTSAQVFVIVPTIPESGTDEGEVTAASWPFFEAMHSAIGQRPSVLPVASFSSGPSAQISPSDPSSAVVSDCLQPPFTPSYSEPAVQDAVKPGSSGDEESVDPVAEEIPRPSARPSGGKECNHAPSVEAGHQQEQKPVQPACPLTGLQTYPQKLLHQEKVSILCILRLKHIIMR
ncbi:unnamed protein product [Leuciscus chuanchicus]